MSIPLWPQSIQPLVTVSSRKTHCLPKLRFFQAGFLNTTVCFLYSKCLSIHQISIQQSINTMWWNRRFTSRMCRQQIFSNCMMLSYQCDSKSLRNDSSTLLNLLDKEWRGSVSKRGWKIRSDQQFLKRFEVVWGKLYLKVLFLQIIYMLRKQVNNCTWQH